MRHGLELIALFELASHVCKVACCFSTKCFQVLSTDLKENYLFGRNSYSWKSVFVNFRIKGESNQSKQADMKLRNSELKVNRPT